MSTRSCRSAVSYGCIVALIVPILAGLAQAQTSWAEVDLWRKWPSPSGSNLDTQGIWAPPTPKATENPGTFYGVHGALLYDATYERPKLLVMNDELLVYDLAITDSATTVDLNNPVLPANGHQPFCSGLVPLGDKLLIVGGRIEDGITGLPVTTGWASIFDPTDPITFSNWVPTDSLPERSGRTNRVTGYTNCPSVDSTMARYYPTAISIEDVAGCWSSRGTRGSIATATGSGPTRTAMTRPSSS
jgi:hypothetical protein